eukprot:3318650-Prymnesium_polylepis.1
MAAAATAAAEAAAAAATYLPAIARGPVPDRAIACALPIVAIARARAHLCRDEPARLAARREAKHGRYTISRFEARTLAIRLGGLM